MANNQRRRPPFIIRPTFLLFCFYVIVYIGMRHREEIVVQSISLPAMRGAVYQTVTPSPSIPFWRQQLWRAVFSFGMVVEEEGRRVAAMGEGMMFGSQAGGGFGNTGSGGNTGAPGRAGNMAAPTRSTNGTGVPGLVHPVPPSGGLTTDQVIENQIRLTEMTGEAVSGLNPGEQLIYVAPPGERVQRTR